MANPIPSDPDRTRIMSEFGFQTSQEIPNPSSLKQMYEKIIDPNAEHSRVEFGGYGQPDIPSVSYSKTDTSITANYSVTINKSNTTVRLERYTIENENTESEYILVKQVSVNTHSSDATGQTLTLPYLSNTTTYKVRLRVYNGFNSSIEVSETSNEMSGDDWLVFADQEVTTNTPPVQLTNLTFIYEDTFNNVFYHTWEYPATGGNFDLKFDEDALGDPDTWYNGAINNLTYEGNNVWSGGFRMDLDEQDPDPSFPSAYAFAIKRSGTNEPWTKTPEYLQDTQNGSDLDVATNSASSIGENSATLSLTVSNFDNIANQQYIYKFQYRVKGLSTWTDTTGQTSDQNTTHTQNVTGLNDGTTYEFRGYGENFYDSAKNDYGNIVEFTTDEALSPNPPTSVNVGEQFSSLYASWSVPSPVPDSYEYEWYIDGMLVNSGIEPGLATSTQLFHPCQYTFESFPSVQFRIRSVIGTEKSFWASRNTFIQC